MELSPEEFHTILRQAGQRARKHRPPWMDTQDLTQAAELAMLEAQDRGRIEAPADSLDHLRNRTRQRAFGAMIDEIRKGGRQQINASVSYDDSQVGELAHGMAPDDPLRTVQMKLAVEKLARVGSTDLLQAVTLMAAGIPTHTIARVLDKTPSRVSQLKAEAKRILSLWGDL